MPTLGILAYGSLIEEPGPEIDAALLRTIPDVRTPFHIEFARKSSSRGDAPSLVPVDTGGASVAAQILVLKDGVTEDEGKDLIWRRETRNIGSGKRYVVIAKPGPNTVVVKRLANFRGIDAVLYTHIGANIDPLTPAELARLAVASVPLADPGKDGITYLINALRRGLETPLSAAYAQEILRLAGTSSLADALAKLRT